MEAVIADQKLTALTAFTPALTDIIYAVDDPGGTPVSGKVTFTSIRDLFEANRGTDLPIADGGTGASTVAGAQANLIVPGLTSANTFTENQTIQSDDAGATSGPQLILDRNSASPAGGDDLGNIRFVGRDSLGNSADYATIRGEIKDPTDASEDGHILFTTLVGAAGGIRMTLGAGLFMQGATGSDQGTGTINATTVYDDGSALCAVIEEAVTGSYDEASWRKLAPHSGLAAYEALKGRGRNPQSADDYSAEIDSHNGLPGMWNKAEWEEIRSTRRVSVAEREERLMLALDLAALAIRDLTQRVKALESV